MKLSQIGEFGLIDLISKHQSRNKTTIVGIGDDAAVLINPKSENRNPNKYLLITTDALVENVHFKKKGLSFYHLGQKALLANISDIAAMGGAPTHAVITIGLPKNTNVHDIKELYRGINAIAKKNKIDIVGGDTVASPKAIFISITLLGEVEKEYLLLRSGAKPGDLICVTGVFGGEASKKYETRNSCLPAGTAKYETRLRESRIIAKNKIASSMTDSSDGLVRSVVEICKASNVGAVIEENKVPIAEGATLKQALYGGEEYELVFTVPEGKASSEKGVGGVRRIKGSTIIGRIVPKGEGISLEDKRGRITKLKSMGYEHFHGK
ncbi:MAG: thiamine-phosphate kinase [Candidatus Margulisiibacteriota bacterium]